jgi:hypothetical protein
MDNLPTPQTALKYEVEIGMEGQIELNVPFPAGTRVVVFVVEQQDEFTDLLSAAGSSLTFWNNPLDEEDWSNA